MPHLLFELTAADFNGKDFDGAPFDYVGKYDPENRIVIPVSESIDTDCQRFQDAIATAVQKGKLAVHTKNGTDYAQWEVPYDGGVIDYGPGDYVLVVGEAALVWIPGSVIAALGIKIPETKAGA